MSAMLRTFVALSLPQTAITALGQLQEGLKRCRLPVRWVRPDNIHLTLKFLGDTPPTVVPAVSDALAVAVSGAAPFYLGLKGVGVFPGIKAARVIWAGLYGDVAQVIDLQQAVETSLFKVGFPRDKRSFKAHLTLGRIKAAVAPAQMAEALAAFSTFSAKRFVADAVTLFKSDLQPSGAVYTSLKRIALVGG